MHIQCRSDTVCVPLVVCVCVLARCLRHRGANCWIATTPVVDVCRCVVSYCNDCSVSCCWTNTRLSVAGTTCLQRDYAKIHVYNLQFVLLDQYTFAVSAEPLCCCWTNTTESHTFHERLSSQRVLPCTQQYCKTAGEPRQLASCCVSVVVSLRLFPRCTHSSKPQTCKT